MYSCLRHYVSKILLTVKDNLTDRASSLESLCKTLILDRLVGLGCAYLTDSYKGLDPDPTVNLQENLNF